MNRFIVLALAALFPFAALAQLYPLNSELAWDYPGVDGVSGFKVINKTAGDAVIATVGPNVRQVALNLPAGDHTLVVEAYDTYQASPSEPFSFTLGNLLPPTNLRIVVQGTVSGEFSVQMLGQAAPVE